MNRVIFRKWGKANGGGVIALLPDVEANPGQVMMYEHIGQHGEGSPNIIGITKLAKPEEYASLLSELKSIGYDGLRVMERLNSPIRP